MDIDGQIDLEIRMREEIERLENSAEEAGKAEPPESLDGTIGRLSRQDAMLHYEMERAAERAAEKRLYLLRQALERMDRGTYGKCLCCGGGIPDERLREIPETPVCAGCPDPY